MVAKGKSKAQIRAEDRIAALVNSPSSRSTAKRRQRDGIPDIYQEMLSEAAASSEVEDINDRPPKKQRLESQDADELDTESPKRPLQTVEDSGESDDDDMDWEEIGFDQPEHLTTIQTETQDEIADISVEVGAKKTPKKVAAKRKPITTAERLMRLAVHEAHILFLIFHVHVRNSWCNLGAVQSKLRPLLPAKIISLLHPREDIIQFSRSENFINGLKVAVDFWQARFRVVESGMQQPQWAECPDDIKQRIASISDNIPSVDKPGFIRRASALKGSQDIGNQLFCALLRSVGVEARLVCSIQPLPFGVAAAKSGISLREKSKIYADGHSDGAISAEEGSLTGSASETSKPPQGRRRRIGQPNFAIGGSSKPPPPAPVQKKSKPSTIRKLEYPVFWVEVFNSAYQTWVTVDATVTGTINKPGKLEPPISYNLNTMSYVVAFDEHGYARDVTRRYTKAYNAKTRKLRVESTKNGEKWLRKALKPFRRRDQTDRVQVEDAELAKKEAQEGMPNNVQDFKDHPYYALERHLKRHEAIFPKREVGKLNAGKSSSSNVESVYRRGDVQIVQSADKWYRVGREIKPGEQPLKHVPARRGINAQRDDDDDEAPMTALYGFSQTTLYIPPKVVDGRIPKNAYGNLDVYVSSMVPPGAVHVRHALAAKAAKVLSIDFADAVTGFTFKGRIGEAVKNGVVVANDYEDAMNATIKGFEDAAKQEEDAKRSLECLRLWRRFLTGLRIGERLGMYENKDATGVSSKKVVESVRKELDDTEEKQGEAMEAGGFFPDAGEETMPSASRFGSATAQPRSLLARAQAEAEADEEDHSHEEEVAMEDIAETAPRLRRQRKITIHESEEDGNNDDDSADEFVPEDIIQRPTPSRRIRGKTAKSRLTKDIPEKVTSIGTRRSTRQTRSQRKLVEETSNDEEAEDEAKDEDGKEEDVKSQNISDTVMSDASENGGGGFFIPDAENERAENIINDYSSGGGGFLPESPPAGRLVSAREIIDDYEGGGGGGFIPEEEEEAEENRGGGFIPEEEGRGGREGERTNVKSTKPRTAIITQEDNDVGMNGEGFIPEDEDEDGDGRAKTSVKEGQDQDVNGDGIDSTSDHGSLLSHDPEDEDAEPEWLNSD